MTFKIIPIYDLETRTASLELKRSGLSVAIFNFDAVTQIVSRPARLVETTISLDEFTVNLFELRKWEEGIHIRKLGDSVHRLTYIGFDLEYKTQAGADIVDCAVKVNGVNIRFKFRQETHEATFEASDALSMNLHIFDRWLRAFEFSLSLIKDIN